MRVFSSPTTALIAAAALLLTAPGCADDSGDGTVAGSGGSTSGSSSGGNFSTNARPKLEVSERATLLNNQQPITLNLGTVEPGETSEMTYLTLANQGEDLLIITAVTVSSQPEGVLALQIDGSPIPLPPVGPNIEINPFESQRLNVILTRPDDEQVVPAGNINIQSNSSVNDSTNLNFPVQVDGGAPEIQISPSPVDFGNVSIQNPPVGEPKTLSILNTGNGTLEITGFRLEGDGTFTFGLNDYEACATALPNYCGDGLGDPEVTDNPCCYPLSDPLIAGQTVTLPEPLIVNQGQSVAAWASFTPVGPDKAEALITFFSNDPNETSGTPVDLLGNQSGPKICIEPTFVDFGGQRVGEQATVQVKVTSCGEGPAVVEQIEIMPEFEDADGATVDTSIDFGLDLMDFVGEPVSVDALTAPIEMAVNEVRYFDVTFTPDEVNPVGDDQLPVPDLGRIKLVSNSFVAEQEVAIEGYGVPADCPVPIIVVEEGDEVIPQTKLHLSGTSSYGSPNSVIDEYRWEVVQPIGSQSFFLPSASASTPTFTANAAGEYTFKLFVKDSAGYESGKEASGVMCEPAVAKVFVNPDEAIHVELLWSTPADPDETDTGPEAGADLDLHFAHPFASPEVCMDNPAPAANQPCSNSFQSNGWFDSPYDCFWFNAQPNWYEFDPNIDDDPGLDLDDTDGAGPENVNLNIPEDGAVYRVGVHYWNDHNFGPSLATVRIYIYSTLVFQLSDVELNHHDMWEVASIAWPSAQVTLKTDAVENYDIQPNYSHPFFPAPSN